MHAPASNRTTRQPLALIGGTTILAATLLAAAFAQSASEPPIRPHSAASPQLVAETLDSIVQPRFQQNAGRFGMDRVFSLDGHGNVHWVESDSRAERRRFAMVKASHRPYVIAFLHTAHKPGAHIDPPTKPVASDQITPSINALTAVGATQKGAGRMYDWVNAQLKPVVTAHLATLKQGQSAQADYQNWVVVMRPVRALHAGCITCHAGAQRGDTLGVMVYAVDKNQKIKKQSFVAPGGP